MLRRRIRSSKTLGQPLGHLESRLMDVLWDRGESSVNDALQHLGRRLAYTTVMTTLDRLYKKGLLYRRKFERAYLYSPSWTRDEFQRKRAGDFLSTFLAERPSGELLLSCLVDAVGQQDAGLLEELERKIRQKRKELDRLPKR